VLVPRVVRELSGRRVLATEFVDGLLRLDDAAALAREGLDPMELGACVAEAFAELSLVHGLVHGDPHAGNVYARRRPDPGPSSSSSSSPPPPPSPPPQSINQVVILDHGLYHRLSDDDRLGLCALILACARPWPSSRTVRRLAGRFVLGNNNNNNNNNNSGGGGGGSVGVAVAAAEALLPALISPSFAMATARGFRDLRVTLRAASRGRLPEGTTLDDVWSTLVSMRGGGGGGGNGESRSSGEGSSSSSSSSSASGETSAASDLLGLLHSMGYIRGLQNALGLPEKDRVKALALAAARAVWESEQAGGNSSSGGGGGSGSGSGSGGGDDRRLRQRLRRTARLVDMQFLLLRVVAAIIHALGWLFPLSL
jgi:hypothetical protein